MITEKAFVRKPGKSMIQGISTAGLGAPDYALAMAQHAHYVRALEDCGVEVIILGADEAFPDSTFVEDTAVLIPACAILTRPGAATRLGEVAAIQPVLAEYFPRIEEIQAPGTLEGGDVLQVGKHFYVGLSGRTNEHGFAQFANILSRYGYSASVVEVGDLLHLKTGISYLSENNILVCDGLLGKDTPFKDFRRLVVGEEEAYAANSICVNGVVIVAEGFPKTRQVLQDAGYPIMAVDVSEFRKLDGGLSCLSLRC